MFLLRVQSEFRLDSGLRHAGMTVFGKKISSNAGRPRGNRPAGDLKKSRDCNCREGFSPAARVRAAVFRFLALGAVLRNGAAKAAPLQFENTPATEDSDRRRFNSSAARPG
jgi:hypothetical protein